jgi:hypothetical protein
MEFYTENGCDMGITLETSIGDSYWTQGVTGPIYILNDGDYSIGCGYDVADLTFTYQDTSLSEGDAYYDLTEWTWWDTSTAG